MKPELKFRCNLDTWSWIVGAAEACCAIDSCLSSSVFRWTSSVFAAMLFMVQVPPDADSESGWLTHSQTLVMRSQQCCANIDMAAPFLNTLVEDRVFEQLGLFSWIASRLILYCYYPWQKVNAQMVASWHVMTLPELQVAYSFWKIKGFEQSLLVRILDSITFDLISSCSWVFAVWIVYHCLHYICQFCHWFCDSPKWFWYPVFHREDLAAELVLQSLAAVVQLEPLIWQLKLRPRLAEGTKARVRWGLKSRSVFAVVVLKNGDTLRFFWMHITVKSLRKHAAMKIGSSNKSPDIDCYWLYVHFDLKINTVHPVYLTHQYSSLIPFLLKHQSPSSQVPDPTDWLYPPRPYPSHAWKWDR